MGCYTDSMRSFAVLAICLTLLVGAVGIATDAEPDSSAEAQKDAPESMALPVEATAQLPEAEVTIIDAPVRDSGVRLERRQFRPPI